MARAATGRVLGLDLGDVRIGVAISDPDRRLALPFGNLKAGAPHDIKAVVEMVAGNDITEVVVGHPLSLSGEPGPMARKTEEFASTLASVLNTPVHLHDERLSSVEAGKALRDAGASNRQSRSAVDASAAAVVLQSWLDASA